VTLKPSNGSLILSAVVEILRVADVEPAGIVTVPERASISLLEIVSTVRPLLSAVTV